jgi:hypothetical protein
VQVDNTYVHYEYEVELAPEVNALEEQEDILSLGCFKHSRNGTRYSFVL